MLNEPPTGSSHHYERSDVALILVARPIGSDEGAHSAVHDRNGHIRAVVRDRGARLSNGHGAVANFDAGAVSAIAESLRIACKAPRRQVADHREAPVE